jgi:hypothetical protein
MTPWGRSSVPHVSDAPIELLALDEPYEGAISARRVGEPSFTHVQDFGDAYMAAQTRGVRLVIPKSLADQLREVGDLPPELPPGVEVRAD